MNTKKQCLPYLIASFGLLFSFILWYLLKFYLDTYLHTLSNLQTYIAWLFLLFGISFSILIGSIIRIVQLDRERSLLMKQMNETIKKEIGGRINAEETNQKLEVAMLQGQKLQAIGTLAGGIAHDFNNILYAIIGYTEMVREDIDKNSLTSKNLGKILEATHRGQELISRILAFSRRQHHQFDAINLKNTIEAALSLLRPTIPASVIIHFEPEVNATIMGNQTQIHQVLVNLINNAVDAMDEEGIIHIKMTHIPANDLFLRGFPEIPHEQPYCKIEITDTGHGMDQATMERIFEPFFTTKEVGKGSGLGLSIVHSIIKEHQGDITVSSQLGHGTTFVIVIPEHLAK